MIYSFYSYKGGVGRTHLLVNIASYLCFHKKRRILLIDWDLEAPGLHYYFEQANRPIALGKGLMDLLYEFITLRDSLGKDSTITEEQMPFPTHQNDYIKTLRATSLGGRLDILPAIDYAQGDYTQRINNFHWRTFFEKQDGNKYLVWLKNKLKSQYDYIFIDSRTGSNDYSGICNVLMPDANVLVMASNQQNFQGCVRMAERICASDYRNNDHKKPFILPILSRIDENAATIEEARQWRKDFAKAFGKYIVHWGLPDVQKPLADSILETAIAPMTSANHTSIFSIGEKTYFNEDSWRAGFDIDARLEVFMKIADNFIEKTKENSATNTPFNFDSLLGAIH
ncbi:MAG: ParA family protein [Bacteroidetes bacterium]|nr:MAG: ParA family protein [Bacteroidota bacterium]